MHLTYIPTSDRRGPIVVGLVTSEAILRLIANENLVPWIPVSIDCVPTRKVPGIMSLKSHLGFEMFCIQFGYNYSS